MRVIIGVSISGLFHNGSHPDYTTQIKAWLDHLDGIYSNKTAEEAASFLSGKLKNLKSTLQNISENINTIDLDLF